VSDLPLPPAPTTGFPAARADAVETAADRARLAPSVHNTQPWVLVVEPDCLELRADPTRRLPVLDPIGRALVISVGAALMNARVALAARGFRVVVDRLPDPADPDLLAVVRPVPGRPDAELAGLDDAVPRRRSNRRAFTGATPDDPVLRRLTRAAAQEDTELVPVVSEEHRRLVARLTQEADRVQNADPAYRAELRRWTTRDPGQGDGVPARTVRHVEGDRPEDVPLRDFDTQGAGGLPEAGADEEQALLLLATRDDGVLAWLRCGEALERVLLELTALGWAASPVTQAVEVPVTRMQLRSALTWDGHPQVLLRVGRAAGSPAAPRRDREDVVHTAGQRFPPPPPSPGPGAPPARRPVSDGRGGTTWT
jgi:nitroreductase